jgi:hypothetical protein
MKNFSYLLNDKNMELDEMSHSKTFNIVLAIVIVLAVVFIVAMKLTTA